MSSPSKTVHQNVAQRKRSSRLFGGSIVGHMMRQHGNAILTEQVAFAVANASWRVSQSDALPNGGIDARRLEHLGRWIVWHGSSADGGDSGAEWRRRLGIRCGVRGGGSEAVVWGGGEAFIGLSPKARPSPAEAWGDHHQGWTRGQSWQLCGYRKATKKGRCRQKRLPCKHEKATALYRWLYTS